MTNILADWNNLNTELVNEKRDKEKLLRHINRDPINKQNKVNISRIWNKQANNGAIMTQNSKTEEIENLINRKNSKEAERIEM